MKTFFTVLTFAVCLCLLPAIAMEEHPPNQFDSRIRKILYEEQPKLNLNTDEIWTIDICFYISRFRDDEVVRAAMKELIEQTGDVDTTTNSAKDNYKLLLTQELIKRGISLQHIGQYKLYTTFIQAIDKPSVHININSVTRAIVEENDTHLIKTTIHTSCDGTLIETEFYSAKSVDEIEKEPCLCCGKNPKYDEFVLVGSESEHSISLRPKENFSRKLIDGFLNGKYLIGIWSNETQKIQFELRSDPHDSLTKVSLIKELALK